MALVYHGTDIYRGISIARNGAILSNLEQQIEWFKKLYREQPSRNFEEEYPGKTMEQVALEIQSSLYGEHEIEARVNCLTIVMKKEPTIHYAMRFEYNDGGLILGIDLDDSYVQKLARHYGNSDIKFVPRKLSIDRLKELHLSPVAKRKHEALIKKEFDRYRPNYFLITTKAPITI